MKNVTITLPDDLAHWARIRAAQEGKSLSRYLADRLQVEKGRGVQAATLARLRMLPPLLLTDEAGKAPSRESLRERHNLR